MIERRFEFFSTPIFGLTVIQRKPVKDNRGFFCRFYCLDEFHDIGANLPIVQINHTLTKIKGTVRGLHFQYPPYLETKIISCIRGEIFDVAVDIRHGSQTFLKWHAEILSAANYKSLLIPKGFAHGFQTLTDGCELIYLHTAAYAPDAEGGLRADDSRIGIKWPIEITMRSRRDSNFPEIGEDFNGVEL